MIVGLNLLYLLPGVVGGTETYAAGLLDGLSQLDENARFLVYCNRESSEWPLPADARFTRVVCPVWATSRARRYWYEQRVLPRRAQDDGIDVLHSLGYVAPLTLRCPSVVTVPDLHFLVHGRAFDWPRRALLRYFVRKSIDRAAAVIAISTFTRDALVRTYNLRMNAVDVVLLAPKPRGNSAREVDSETLQALGIAKPYVLAFGGVTPNKNIERMLQAYAVARRRHAIEQTLVIVGRLPPELAPQALPGVITTGYQSDDVVAVLLRNALSLVFPSLYEGFGLPVLEAMAAGVPVACSNTAAMPEVAADAGLYFDPRDVDGMAEQIRRLCQDVSLRTELMMRARARAAEFGWDRTARATLAVYRRVLSRAASAVPIDVGGPPRRAAKEIS
jgi:glycosyltransferase involved in cell wall biosynthesis